MTATGDASTPAAADPIYWDVAASPLGPLYVAVSRRGLCRIAFDVDEDGFLTELNRLAPGAQVERKAAAVAPAMAQLQAYFADAATEFDLPLDLSSLTVFQQEVLRATYAIPAGQVMTYGEVAAAIGRPRASRAVGQALRRNPLPLVVPCHRVVGSDGSMRGYGGPQGVDIKRRLLEMEGVL